MNSTKKTQKVLKYFDTEWTQKSLRSYGYNCNRNHLGRKLGRKWAKLVKEKGGCSRSRPQVCNKICI